MHSLRKLLQIVCLSFIACHFVIGTKMETSRLPRQVQNSNSCVLPEHPQFGYWSILIGNGRYSPGQFVHSLSVLKVVCNNEYQLIGASLILCENGKWSHPIGTCSKTCPNIYSTNTMKVTCQYNNYITENCTNPVDGTVAKFQCANFHKNTANQNNICRNGSWSQTQPDCIPDCGRKTVDATPLIINGSTTVKGDHPWQVALYQKTRDNALICGGSLISKKLIISAAQCVTDVEGKLRPKEHFVVAVGKYYRKYNDSRDKDNAQFSTIERMVLPPEYRGEIYNYMGDIVILVATKTFVLSRRIQPVCLDFESNYEKDLYNSQKSSYGYVTGWGFTSEDKNPSDVLKELRVPLVTNETCNEKLDEDSKLFLSHDKICAGYYETGTAVCKGDAGGGLVFKHDGRYYLTGVVSTALPSYRVFGGCDSQQISFYTRVATYINLIEKNFYP